jgi:nucleoside-diphosphate-sugar epimerase
MELAVFLKEGIKLPSFHQLKARAPLVRVMGHGMMFDNSKAKRDLGMKFTPIRDALSETVAWYRTQGYAPASEA